YPLSLSFTHRRPHSSPLFPYTTLFRSSPTTRSSHCCRASPTVSLSGSSRSSSSSRCANAARAATASIRSLPRAPTAKIGSKQLRSEEHTSELQSRGQRACRLLHEKKNK